MLPASPCYQSSLSTQLQVEAVLTVAERVNFMPLFVRLPKPVGPEHFSAMFPFPASSDNFCACTARSQQPTFRPNINSQRRQQYRHASNQVSLLIPHNSGLLSSKACFRRSLIDFEKMISLQSLASFILPLSTASPKTLTFAESEPKQYNPANGIAGALFRAKIHPREPEISAEVDSFFLEHWPFVNEEARKKFVAAGFSKVTCFYYPHALDDRISLACRLLTLLFLVDGRHQFSVLDSLRHNPSITVQSKTNTVFLQQTYWKTCPSRKGRCTMKS